MKNEVEKKINETGVTWEELILVSQDKCVR